MKSIVTQKDLAKATGLDQSTVSLALRGDSKVNEKTRERVMKMARKMGYWKDPMMTALASYRGGLRESTHQGTLAWLWDPAEEELPHFKDSVYVHYFNGAKRQAVQHGYQLEKFEVPANPKDHRRLSDILFHRGIEGVLIPPQLVPGPAPQLDWDHFSAVTFGWSVTSPRFHSLSPNHYHNAIELVRNLALMGYRRIGGCVGLNKAEHFNFHLWSHGVETSTENLDGIANIPVFRMSKAEATYVDHFKRWYDQYRPEVIAVNIEHLNFIVGVLDGFGVRCPEDIGIALFYRASQEGHYAGIYENPPYIGGAAVDLLVGTLRRREFGAPEIRRMLQVEGCWRPGPSVKSLV
tara:strand:+ start:59483 stop:60532 length:1050 start_codon:yes stop_codon:yes gene_type:complete